MPIDNLAQISGSLLTRTSNATSKPVARQGIAAATGGTAPPATIGDVKKAVNQLNEFLQSLRRDLQFSVDEGSGSTIVKVIDSNTGELIRQIPPEEILAVSRAMAYSLKKDGILLQDQV